MTRRPIHISSISSGALIAAMAMPVALHAQTANSASSLAPSPTSAQDQPAGDEIVVTATRGNKTLMKSSISVTDVSQQQIKDFTPRSESELFRLIPGIRAEDTAGPGGNANITVRGLPIVTGGAEFVQLQEDGLPTVLFGDMNFGNNDYWVRFDDNVARVEAVRGGSVSTLASQAPGAVINYISETGEKAGGTIGFTKGVNYNENRLDFAYGAPITDTLRFHIGGFLKDGNSPLHIGYTASKGYQIKGNVTKDFADGKGFIRLDFKRLDDREPTYTVAPVLASVNGNEVGNFHYFSDFKAGKDSNQSIYNQHFEVLDYDGQLRTAPKAGIHPKATAIGGQAHYDFNDAISFDDKFRYTWQSGTFVSQFLNVTPASSIIGSTVNGQTVGSIVYAAGPNAGKAFTGSYVNTNPNIDVNMRDMGSLVNDLSLTGKADLMGGKVTAHAGWFHMTQRIAQDWHVNMSYSDVTGNNPAPLDLFTGTNGTGTQLTAAGQAGFNNNWGASNARDYSLDYTDDAPYLALNYNGYGLDLDASVRFDNVKARGSSLAGVNGPDVAVTDVLGTALIPSLLTGGTPEDLHYSTHYTSWSFGALYAFSGNTSLFARASRGGRANADRLILSGYFNGDGSPNAAGDARLKNIVTQQEAGLKQRGRLASGTYHLEATFFRTQVADANYDITTQQSDDNLYHSYGVEIAGGLQFGRFSLTSDATYTHAIIAKDAIGDTSGNVPLATPRFAFLISPSYDAGIAQIGFSVDGQTSTYADNTDQLKIIGQTYVNAFVKVRPYPGVEAGLNVNNLFDTLGFRGRSDGTQPTAASVIAAGAAGGYGGAFYATPVLGRTISANISYRF